MFQQEIIPFLKRDIQNFREGNLKNHLTKWKNVNSDKPILDIIENGLKLDLTDKIQNLVPNLHSHSRMKRN